MPLSYFVPGFPFPLPVSSSPFSTSGRWILNHCATREDPQAILNTCY